MLWGYDFYEIWEGLGHYLCKQLFSVTFSLILPQCQAEWLWTFSHLDAVVLVFLLFPMLGIKGKG